VVIMTADPEALGDLWLSEYAPEFHATERRRYPSLGRIAAALGGPLDARPLRIPLDCTDGFADVFYGRPRRSSIRRPPRPVRLELRPEFEGSIRILIA
jgi:hypothetical protein